MIQLIRNKQLGGVIIGLIILVFSKIFFSRAPDFPFVTYTPLFSSLKNGLENYPGLDIFLGLTFVLIQGGLLTFLLNYHKVISERSFFPFIIYVLLAVVYNEQFYLNPASFLNFFILLIIDRILRLQEAGIKPGNLFLDIGTLLGLAILFSKEAIFYIPVVFIGIAIVRAYSIANLIKMMLSVFMVLFITACIYYLMGDFEEFQLFFRFIPIDVAITLNHWQPRFYLLFGILLLLSVVSFIHFQFNSTKVRNKSRRFAGVFGLLWAVGLFIVIFQELNLWYNMALTVIPITVLSSNYFQEEMGWDSVKNILFTMIVLGLWSVQMNY